MFFTEEKLNNTGQAEKKLFYLLAVQMEWQKTQVTWQ
jgi:hypothetical protein